MEPSLRRVHSGKVRDLYTTPSGELVLVASDRISAFDHVLDSVIPDKGRILTQLSLWWFERVEDLVPHHVRSTELPPGSPAEWAGRALVCERLEMIPVECVARGYLTGSGLADYTRTGGVCGVPLPPGLVEADRLDPPVFTPAAKAPLGEHDENISFEQTAERVGPALAEQLRDLTLAVYVRGVELARERGVLVADTKLEFGCRSDGTVVLGDELLTPDSSRFWPAHAWRPGAAVPSFDKQYVRDWLTSAASGWDRASDQPPPPLPLEVVERTRQRYVDAFERLTGQKFA